MQQTAYCCHGLSTNLEDDRQPITEGALMPPDSDSLRPTQRLKLSADVFFLAVSLLPLTPAWTAETPKVPYHDWGACPFECCTYGEWRTLRMVIAHQKLTESSPESFRVAAGEHVRGITGVVITKRYGIVEILQPVHLGLTSRGGPPELSLQPKELIYTLHHEGEGTTRFWYRGKTYFDQVSRPDGWFGAFPHESEIKVISQPQYSWWVKIRGKNGATGWTSNTDAFAGMDQCD
jgi:hypothetical protein